MVKILDFEEYRVLRNKGNLKREIRRQLKREFMNYFDKEIDKLEKDYQTTLKVESLKTRKKKQIETDHITAYCFNCKKSVTTKCDDVRLRKKRESDNFWIMLGIGICPKCLKIVKSYLGKTTNENLWLKEHEKDNVYRG